MNFVIYKSVVFSHLLNEVQISNNTLPFELLCRSAMRHAKPPPPIGRAFSSFRAQECAPSGHVRWEGRRYFGDGGCEKRVVMFRKREPKGKRTMRKGLMIFQKMASVIGPPTYFSDRGLRGDVQMTSAKFSGFWTPSLPLSVPNPRNLPSFGQNLADPLPPPQSRRHMYMPP